MTDASMSNEDENPILGPPPEFGPKEYREALTAFDAAVCEAIAVGQATSGREVAGHIGYATHVFARICSHAIAFIRAAPKSRWVKSDSELWDFSAVSGHARSIIEGYLLFSYLLCEPNELDDISLKINVMHINDCVKRLGVMEATGNKTAVEFLNGQAHEIRERLRKNPSFLALPQVLQSRLLTGRYLTVLTRDEQLKIVDWDKSWFNTIWDVLSQYTHVLPFSFYNMEPNGRGTGILNDADRGYIALFMIYCTDVLTKSADKMIEMFPDAGAVRQGSDSKFSPGPRRNLPKHRKRERI